MGGGGGAGRQVVERLAATGRPVPKSVERMAKWLDEMEKEGGEVPLLKPGVGSVGRFEDVWGAGQVKQRARRGARCGLTIVTALSAIQQ